MSIQAQVTLRTRKLGVLIRDGRQAVRKTIKECGEAIGVTSGIFRSYEDGSRAPSLPEMELLAYFLDLPMSHFWSKYAISGGTSPTKVLNLPELIAIRQRKIGALLRQEREKVSISLKALSGQSGIPTSRLKSYELGERPIPLPELERLIVILGGKVEALFDQIGPIGQWMNLQKATQDFLQLPLELQDFVCQPVNRPYLELARKLSELPTEKLRSVAENLLDITL